jgi:hypothetical protein
MFDQHTENGITNFKHYRHHYERLFQRGTEHIAKLRKQLGDVGLFSIGPGDNLPLQFRIFGTVLKIEILTTLGANKGSMVAFKQILDELGRSGWTELKRIEFDGIGNIGSQEEAFFDRVHLAFFFGVVESLKSEEVPLIGEAFGAVPSNQS